MLMSITVISAADWTTSDNYKSFEESVGDYGKIIIYDKDFFSSDDKIQEVQLKSYIIWKYAGSFVQHKIQIPFRL